MNDFTFDLEDDLNDAPVKTRNDGHVRTGTVESTISENKIARFEEKCGACRGTGKFYSYTGRLVGNCFKCNGTGVRKFKTSPEARAKAKDSRTNRKNRDIANKAVQAAEWLAANPARAEFLKQDWEFPQSLSRSLQQFGRLTGPQIAGIDKCLRTQAERAAKRAEANKASTDAGLDLSGLLSGLYAVGDVELKVDNLCEVLGKWNGWVFVKSADGDRVGSQRPDQDYRGGQVEALQEILKDPLAAAVSYGRRTGTCGCCGRKLTNPVSIEAGIGPICASKF